MANWPARTAPPGTPVTWDDLQHVMDVVDDAITPTGAGTSGSSTVITTSVFDSTVPANVTLSAGTGTGTYASRADHVHALSQAISPVWTGNHQFTNDVLPTVAYVPNLGLLTKKWLGVYAAELWVETLVAQNTIATIGGRVLVGPTNTLIADLTAIATTMDVKYNNLANGDRVYMEANGNLEWMSVDSGASVITGGYRYTVTRNLDGSGANAWSAGDAVFDTGTTGKGYIDLYSVSGVIAGSTAGPTIVGNVRTGTTYSAVAPRWAMGNLKGLYAYASEVYGFAAGDSTATWVAADATNGFRVMYGSTAKITLDASGNASFSGTITATAGALGGWTIGATTVSATGGTFVLDSSLALIRIGAATDLLVGNGAFLRDTSGGVFRVGTVAAGALIKGILWDGTNLSWIGVNTSLSAAGAFVASSATITGAITATSGSVGSFTIGTYLYTGTKTAWNDANAGVHVGSDGIGIGNNVFTVNGSTGALVATSATITGTINATAGYFGNGTNGVLIDATGVTVAGTGHISTATSGARVEMLATGIKWYDATTQRGQILNDGSGWMGSSTALAWTTAGVLTVGGWTAGATTLTSTGVTLTSTGGITVAAATAGLVDNGYLKFVAAGDTISTAAIYGYKDGAHVNDALVLELRGADANPVSNILLERTGVYLGGWAPNTQWLWVSATGIYPGNQIIRYIADNGTHLTVENVVVATHTHNGANQGGTVPMSAVSGTISTTQHGALGAITNAHAVADINGAAPLASPTFTGTVSIGGGTSAKLDVNTGNDAVQIANFTGLNSGMRFQSNGSRMDLISHNGADSAVRDLLIRQYGATVGILIDTADAVTMGHYGAGTATFDANGKISSVSDIRLKHVQRPFLAELADIQPIVYKWRKESGLDTEHEYAGFSAQELEACDPLMVGRDADGMLTMQDRAVMAAMVNTINSLKKRVAHLETQFAGRRQL